MPDSDVHSSSAPSGEDSELADDWTGARTLVVLCTYNERTNIDKMFELIDQHVPHADVLVVDDNSPDGTAEAVTQRADSDSRFHLLLRPGKLGLGTALRDGIRWCLDRDYDYLVNLDADVSHDPVAIPEMLKVCHSGQADVAVGSRYIPGGSCPGLKLHRKWISRILNTYATRLLRLPLTDCSGSYRCYSTAVLGKLDLQSLECPGYGFLEEILVALKHQGATFAEVPIVFDCRFSGRSKLSLKDALGAIRVIHQLAWGRNR